MFSDSKLAQILHCSRKKTTCISKKAVASKLNGYLCDFMKSHLIISPYDCSNDNNVKKVNATCAFNI